MPYTSKMVKIKCQGCPLDCDTCKWLRVFHYNLNIDFFFFSIIIDCMDFHVAECSPTSNTFAHGVYSKIILECNVMDCCAKSTFSGLFICHLIKQQLTVPTLSCCRVCNRCAPVGNSIDRVDNCSGTASRHDIILFHFVRICFFFSEKCHESNF